MESGVKHIVSRPLTAINYLLFSFQRNHLKIGVVGNIVWFGGLNAGADSDYNRPDYMIRVESDEFAEKTTKIMEA